MMTWHQSDIKRTFRTLIGLVKTIYVNLPGNCRVNKILNVYLQGNCSVNVHHCIVIIFRYLQIIFSMFKLSVSLMVSFQLSYNDKCVQKQH